jgi:hypothetical protein
MAGEWIKFEASTPEKREVFSITAAMGWTDPDLTVGKLLKVWRWFDQQTVGGNADGVTLALLDSIIGVSGFAQAMCNVGWLVSNESGVSLPNFDRHNGRTAKERALTAKRVSKHKANAAPNDKGNARTVTEALPREEKRREEEVRGEAATSPLPASPPTRIGEICALLRRSGVNTSPDAVGKVEWSANDAVTDGVLLDALVLAKKRSPRQITPAYLSPIIADLLSKLETARSSALVAGKDYV